MAKIREETVKPDQEISEEERELLVDQSGADPDIHVVEETPVELPDELLMDNPAYLDSIVSTPDATGMVDTGPLGGTDAAIGSDVETDDGQISYDDFGVEGSDVDLFDEDFLIVDDTTGGLDGRNDAVDGVTGGRGSMNDPLPDVGDPSDAAGDSLHELNLDKIEAIQTDDSLSPEEKQGALDQLGAQIKTTQEGASGERPEQPQDEPPAENDAGSADSGGADSDDDGGLTIEGVIKWLSSFGDGVDPPNTGGVIGGAGNQEILEAAGMTGSGKADQKTVEKAARDQIAENDAPASEKTETKADEKADDTHDVGESESLTGPDVWGDFTDDYRPSPGEHDIDYGEGGGPMKGYADPADADGEEYTGEYGENHTSPTAADYEAGEARAAEEVDPSEEFFDLE